MKSWKICKMEKEVKKYKKTWPGALHRAIIYINYS